MYSVNVIVARKQFNPDSVDLATFIEEIKNGWTENT